MEVEHLPGVTMVLGSIPSTETRNSQSRVRSTHINHDLRTVQNDASGVTRTRERRTVQTEDREW